MFFFPVTFLVTIEKKANFPTYITTYPHITPYLNSSKPVWLACLKIVERICVHPVVFLGGRSQKFRCHLARDLTSYKTGKQTHQYSAPYTVDRHRLSSRFTHYHTWFVNWRKIWLAYRLLPTLLNVIVSVVPDLYQIFKQTLWQVH